jgi:hypothetical protein
MWVVQNGVMSGNNMRHMAQWRGKQTTVIINARNTRNDSTSYP